MNAQLDESNQGSLTDASKHRLSSLNNGSNAPRSETIQQQMSANKNTSSLYEHRRQQCKSKKKKRLHKGSSSIDGLKRQRAAVRNTKKKCVCLQSNSAGSVLRISLKAEPS